MPAFDINTIPSQKGKTAIVTGSNIGLGYETALALAQKDMTVVLACRNLTKATKAKKEIFAQVPHADLDILLLDLSKLSSVRAFAQQFLDKYQRLDLLVNNAGVMVPPFSLTEDGFELQMGVNYFGHFLLTRLLLNRLLETPYSRVVSLGSLAHRRGRINFNDLQSEKRYSAWGAYAQSKLACIMFAYELQRRLAKLDTTTISVAAHPGGSLTNLIQHFPKWVKVLAPILGPLLTHSPKAGAEPTLYAALGKDVKGGDYFGPSRLGELKGRAKKVDSTRQSKDKEVAKKLWTVSEQLTGGVFEF